MEFSKLEALVHTKTACSAGLNDMEYTGVLRDPDALLSIFSFGLNIFVQSKKGFLMSERQSHVLPKEKTKSFVSKIDYFWSDHL